MLTRKDFFLTAIGSVAATLVGCGDSSGTGGAGGTASTTTTGTGTGSSKSSTGAGQMLTCASPAVSIGTNHPVGSEHKMAVAAADVTAGVDKTYDIMGNSIHTHSVTLTAADFATLKSTGTVMVTSTATIHTHVITVTCAS